MKVRRFDQIFIAVKDLEEVTLTLHKMARLNGQGGGRRRL
jgi:hypothetical protein